MKTVRRLIYILLILVLLGIFFYSAGQLWNYYRESSETKVSYDVLSDMIQHARPTESPEEETFDWSKYLGLDTDALMEMPESPYEIAVDPLTGEPVAMLPEFVELYGLNRDTVGWISIEGTNIDYPVVHRADANSYYLYRDFYGNDRKRGCIFAGETCDVFRPSDCVILYGHMMYDGSMFADLHKYTKKEFWQTHRYIRFDTLRERRTYEIICVFKTSATPGRGFRYHTFVDAANAEEFNAFWKGCQENSFYDTGLETGFGDKLLCLSTCEYTLNDGRLVVVAKRVETPRTEDP